MSKRNPSSHSWWDSEDGSLVPKTLQDYLLLIAICTVIWIVASVVVFHYAPLCIFFLHLGPITFIGLLLRLVHYPHAVGHEARSSWLCRNALDWTIYYFVLISPYAAGIGESIREAVHERASEASNVDGLEIISTPLTYQEKVEIALNWAQTCAFFQICACVLGLAALGSGGGIPLGGGGGSSTDAPLPISSTNSYTPPPSEPYKPPVMPPNEPPRPIQRPRTPTPYG